MKLLTGFCLGSKYADSFRIYQRERRKGKNVMYKKNAYSGKVLPRSLPPKRKFYFLPGKMFKIKIHFSSFKINILFGGQRGTEVVHFRKSWGFRGLDLHVLINTGNSEVVLCVKNSANSKFQL